MSDPEKNSVSKPVDENLPAAQPDNQDEYEARKRELLAEIDELVSELRTAVPNSGTDAYSPMLFLSYIRQSLGKLTPDVQLGILESFEGMTPEDAMDIETWKGMAYMLSYSARFQAGQMKDKMNETLPTPLQPDTTIKFMQQTVDKFTPEIANNILETFQGATREDLTDLDTWRGVWTMLNYSMHFQLNTIKDKIMDNREDEYIE